MYAASARARFECEALVLVVTTSEAVARWAAEPIAMGPGNMFHALVLGPKAVPVVVDPAQAPPIRS